MEIEYETLTFFMFYKMISGSKIQENGCKELPSSNFLFASFSEYHISFSSKNYITKKTNIVFATH